MRALGALGAGAAMLGGVAHAYAAVRYASMLELRVAFEPPTIAIPTPWYGGIPALGLVGAELSVAVLALALWLRQTWRGRRVALAARGHADRATATVTATEAVVLAVWCSGTGAVLSAEAVRRATEPPRALARDLAFVWAIEGRQAVVLLSACLAATVLAVVALSLASRLQVVRTSRGLGLVGPSRLSRALVVWFGLGVGPFCVAALGLLLDFETRPIRSAPAPATWRVVFDVSALALTILTYWLIAVAVRASFRHSSRRRPWLGLAVAVVGATAAALGVRGASALEAEVRAPPGPGWTLAENCPPSDGRPSLVTDGEQHDAAMSLSGRVSAAHPWVAVVKGLVATDPAALRELLHAQRERALGLESGATGTVLVRTEPWLPMADLRSMLEVARAAGFTRASFVVRDTLRELRPVLGLLCGWRDRYLHVALACSAGSTPLAVAPGDTWRDVLPRIQAEREGGHAVCLSETVAD